MSKACALWLQQTSITPSRSRVAWINGSLWAEGRAETKQKKGPPHPVMFSCWPSVIDDGPAQKPHRVYTCKIYRQNLGDKRISHAKNGVQNLVPQGTNIPSSTPTSPWRFPVMREKADWTVFTKCVRSLSDRCGLNSWPCIETKPILCFVFAGLLCTWGVWTCTPCW